MPRLHVGAVTPVLGSTSIETRACVWFILSTCHAVAAAPHMRGHNRPTLCIDAATGSVSPDSTLVARVTGCAPPSPRQLRTHTASPRGILTRLPGTERPRSRPVGRRARGQRLPTGVTQLLVAAERPVHPPPEPDTGRRGPSQRTRSPPFPDGSGAHRRRVRRIVGARPSARRATPCRTPGLATGPPRQGRPRRRQARRSRSARACPTLSCQNPATPPHRAGCRRGATPRPGRSARQLVGVGLVLVDVGSLSHPR